MQHKSAPIPTLPDSLAEYQPLLNKMMAKTPDERYDSADQVVQEIETLIARKKLAKSEHNTKSSKNTKKTTTLVLISLLILSSVFFFSLQFVEIRIKRGTSVKYSETSVATATAPPPVVIQQELTETIATVEAKAERAVSSVATSQDKARKGPASADVVRALEWLGAQSIRESRLDAPPKDNALYYFTKLLKMQPDNVDAYKGILSIAEEYASLAERTLATDNLEQTRVYVERGLQIDPNNESLLTLKSLVNNQNRGLWGMIKALFQG